jgi:hypothetical protein
MLAQSAPVGQAAHVGARAGSRIPPFVLTSGRTHGDLYLGLETLVRAIPQYRSSTTGFSPELQLILTLCKEPASIAEISALAKLHLGVTRILVGDLHASGHLEVWGGADPVTIDDQDTLLRILKGLRALS